MQSLHFSDKENVETTTKSYLQPSADTLPVTTPSVFLPCQNEGNLIEEHVAITVELAIHAVILPLLMLSGVTANVFNMVVFFRQGLSDRINLCLFSLAVSDTAYLVTLMTAKSFTILSFVDEVVGSYWKERNLNTVLGLFLGFLNISNALTAVIAVERCICVAAPFRARRLLKTKHMAAVIVGIYVIILGIYSLLNTKFDTVPLLDDSSNVTKYVSRLSKFYVRHIVVIEILYQYLLNTGIPAISLVIVIISTCITVHKLRATVIWHYHHNRASVCSAEQREAAVTSMLVAICCLNVTCLTPFVISAVLRIALPEFLPSGRYCNTFRVVTALVHFLGAVNASVNFFIYYRRSSNYRKTLSMVQEESTICRLMSCRN